MTMLRLFVFLLRYVLYIAATLLFRVYLLLIFCTKRAAPLLVTLALAGLFWLSWPLTGAPWQALAETLCGWMLQASAALPEADGRRQLAELAFAAAPAVLLGLALLVLYWLLGVWRNVLLFLLPAFPYPQRPVPPIWPVRARRHVIERVDCSIETPRLPLRYWDGDLAPLLKGLAPPLRQIIEAEDQTARQTPVFAPERPEAALRQPEPAEPQKQAPESIPEAPAEDLPAATAKPRAPAKRRNPPAQPTKGPKLPPNAKPVQVSESYR